MSQILQVNLAVTCSIFGVTINILNLNSFLDEIAFYDSELNINFPIVNILLSQEVAAMLLSQLIQLTIRLQIKLQSAII